MKKSKDQKEEIKDEEIKEVAAEEQEIEETDQEDQFEEADEYADELFALAEAEPELGGAALVTLAYSVAERRQAAATDFPDPSGSNSQLELFRIALRTAQAAFNPVETGMFSWMTRPLKTLAQSFAKASGTTAAGIRPAWTISRRFSWAT